MQLVESTKHSEDTDARRPATGAKVPAAARDLTRVQIRGSSLLLTGKFLALGVSLGSQVLLVRYLITSDYGAWTYALSVVTLLHSFAALGLDRAIVRFASIYHEKQQYEKLLGSLLLVGATVLLTGLAIISAFYAFPEQIARMVNGDPRPVTLLFILIFMVPVEALDAALIGMFACFTRARDIFFRKHVLGPALRLGAVLVLILQGSEVAILAWGYLAAGILGVLISAGLLLRTLSRQGLLDRFQFSLVQVPSRDIFSFTLPLLTSDLVTALMQTVGALLLGYFCGLDEVALFRAAVPLAMLNLVVMRSFAFLYTAVAARLFARGDYAGINDLYWRTAAWMAVLTFPIFAVTFCAARPLTVFLYGERYAASGVLLALLSLGQYFNAALGFNGLTLNVLGKVRYLVTINVLAALTSLLLNLLLIPPLGVLGAAIGSAGALIAHNVLKQSGLRLAMGVDLFHQKYSGCYWAIVQGALGLLLVAWLVSDSLYVLLPLAGLASLLVLQHSKRSLQLTETFPELRRLPWLRVLVT